MAAAQLDKNWENWTARLSESYAQTRALLEQEKTDEAAVRYRAGFVSTVKQLFSEAADVYPLRFEGATCWADWTRQLYRLSLQTEKAFNTGRKEEAAALLPKLRYHFYDLHMQCNSVKSNDALFAVMEAMDGDDAPAQVIADAVAVLRDAEPSRQTTAEGEAYQETRDRWLEEIRPLLESNPFTDAERIRLRQATLPFYNTYGNQFE